MALLKTFKVNALPAFTEPNAIYYVKDDDLHFQIYITDDLGSLLYKPYADAKTFSFSTYSLPVATSGGTLDLSTNQVFKIDTSASGVVPITFTNPPTNSTVVIVECVGGASTVTFPSGFTVVDGVDIALGAARSIFTIFYDGEKYFLINNSKIAA